MAEGKRDDNFSVWLLGNNIHREKAIELAAVSKAREKDYVTIRHPKLKNTWLRVSKERAEEILGVKNKEENGK